jgi:hypothetical protein
MHSGTPIWCRSSFGRRAAAATSGAAASGRSTCRCGLANITILGCCAVAASAAAYPFRPAAASADGGATAPPQRDGSWPKFWATERRAAHSYRFAGFRLKWFPRFPVYLFFSLGLHACSITARLFFSGNPTCSLYTRQTLVLSNGTSTASIMSALISCCSLGAWFHGFAAYSGGPNFEAMSGELCVLHHGVRRWRGRC